MTQDLTDESKFMFLNILGSLPNSPFRELTHVCQHALPQQPLPPLSPGLAPATGPTVDLLLPS